MTRNPGMGAKSKMLLEPNEAKSQKLAAKNKNPGSEPGSVDPEKGSSLCLRCDAVHFLQTGGLAAQSANVEQLRAAHLVAANLLNLVDNL